MDDRQALMDFYEFFWGSEEGYVYLPTKDREGVWKKTFYHWPKSRESVLTHTFTATASGKDVFFAPVVFSTPVIDKKVEIKGSHVLWADFDGSAPEDWSLEPSEAVNGAARPRSVPIPSLRIQSSTEDHQHVYWKLDHFSSDISFIEEKNRAIAYTSKADLSGWDAQQVLRPPYTTNYKHDLPVFVAEESALRYSTGDFDSLKSAKQIVTEELEVGKTVPLNDIFAGYIWPKDQYEMFMQDSPTGDRSSALIRISYFGTEQGMTDLEIFSLLIHADDRWGKFRGRADRVRRLSDIINRCRQKHPVGLTNNSFAGLLKTQEVDLDKKYFYQYNDFVNSEFHVEWLVTGSMSTTGIGLITSAPGVGKTQLSIQIGCAVALGKELIGYIPEGPANVLYLSLEMGGPATKQFIGEMAQGYTEEERDILQENFYIAPLGEAIFLDRPEGKKFFEFLIAQNSFKLVIIDSLGRLTGGELSDDTAMRRFFSYLDAVKEKYKCSFLIIHHNRKGTSDNKKPSELSDVFGSQYITASVDYVVSLWRSSPQDKVIHVNELKNRLAVEREPFRIKRIEHLQFEVTHEVASPMSPNANIFSGKEEKNESDNPTVPNFVM